MYTIQIIGLDALEAKIKATLPAIRKGLEGSAWWIFNEAQMYTGDSHGIPQHIVSEKQRRFIFVLLKQGKIPYQRVGSLAAGWGSGPVQIEDLAYSITNTTKYGPYVVGHSQSMQHAAGGWQKYDAKIEKQLQQTLARIKYHLDMAYG
jgi:hypothetical protein